MNRLVLLVVALLAACGSHASTAPGLVGNAVDLRAHLPADVAKRAPTDDKATRYEASFDVHGAQTKVIWYVFADGANKWLLSERWEVVTPAPSITIAPGNGTYPPENQGTPTAVVESVIVMVTWKDNVGLGEHWGQMTFKISADGTSSKT